MENNKEYDFDQLIGQRLDKIRIHLGLETKGFAKLIDRSTSHVYSLLSGRRSLPENLAKVIARSAGLSSDQIYNLNNNLTGPIGDTKYMEEFRKENRLNKEYFIETQEERKLTTFIKINLLQKGYFLVPKRAADVVKICKELGQKEKSERITKSLTYLVKLELLKFKKAPILLTSGKKGMRKVNVYWQESYNNSISNR